MFISFKVSTKYPSIASLMTNLKRSEDKFSIPMLKGAERESLVRGVMINT